MIKLRRKSTAFLSQGADTSPYFGTLSLKMPPELRECSGCYWCSLSMTSHTLRCSPPRNLLHTPTIRVTIQVIPNDSRWGADKSSPKGATDMDKERMAELEKIEAHGAKNGWVAPMAEEDREFFAYFRSVFKRYNISPSKATRLEYDFVTRVAESEFYLQKANA